MVTPPDLKSSAIAQDYLSSPELLTAGSVDRSTQDSWWLVNFFIILLCLASVATVMYAVSNSTAGHRLSAAAGMRGKYPAKLRGDGADRLSATEEVRILEEGVTVERDKIGSGHGAG
ncbi:hypothetical protein LTR95_013038 [Oleoguttula sp. CCFEE 5521]